MSDDEHEHTRSDGSERDDGPFYMKATLWKPAPDDESSSGETLIEEGFYGEPSRVDCVNALLYDIGGRKSDLELTYVDEIRPVESDDEAAVGSSTTPDDTAPGEHAWELKGGGSGASTPTDPVEGHALFQCRACGLATARKLTTKHGGLDSVVSPPDVDEPCDGGGST